MIVRSEDLEWDMKKRDGLNEDLAEAALIGKIDPAEAESLAAGCGDPIIKDTHQFCFVCGHRLAIPAVMWHGIHGKSQESAEVWLHPDCAEDLAHRLLRDTDELKYDKATADTVFEQWKTKRSE